MKKFFIIIVLCIIVFLSACSKYDNVNSPRETVTMKSNILTTVTSDVTSHADTYSEYKSMLNETTLSDVIESPVADTAVSEKIESETAVTTVPVSENQYYETVTCQTTVPQVRLDDIPAVPSENVKADTAINVSD